MKPAFFALLTLVTIGCTNDAGQPVLAERQKTDGRNDSAYSLWDKPDPELARLLSPPEAKAIVVARAAIERNYRAQDWRVELRFFPKPTPDGWEVRVLTVQHMKVGDHEVETPSIGMPTVLLDNEYRFLKVRPGA
jgi:hypothetical protein